MKVKSKAKYQRISTRKVNRVLSMIRKKSAKEAMIILNMLPHTGARIIEQALKSAIANAKNNYKLKPENLVVTECHSGPSFTMKRMRPGPRGRAMPVLKRTSHITVIVEEV